MDPVLTQIFAMLGIALSGGGAIAVITVAVINKFGKGTTDRHNEVTLGVSILEKQIDRAVQEKEGWSKIETYLRDELRKSESDKSQLRDLLQTAESRIGSLERERKILLLRQILLKEKFLNGEKITLRDITGEDLELPSPLGDMEDTYLT